MCNTAISWYTRANGYARLRTAAPWPRNTVPRAARCVAAPSGLRLRKRRAPRGTLPEARRRARRPRPDRRGGGELEREDARRRRGAAVGRHRAREARGVPLRRWRVPAHELVREPDGLLGRITPRRRRWVAPDDLVGERAGSRFRDSQGAGAVLELRQYAHGRVVERRLPRPAAHALRVVNGSQRAVALPVQLAGRLDGGGLSQARPRRRVAS